MKLKKTWSAEVWIVSRSCTFQKGAILHLVKTRVKKQRTSQSHYDWSSQNGACMGFFFPDNFLQSQIFYDFVFSLQLMRKLLLGNHLLPAFHFKGSACHTDAAAAPAEHSRAPTHLLVTAPRGLLKPNGTWPGLYQLSHLQVHSGLAAVTDINGKSIAIDTIIVLIHKQNLK